MNERVVAILECGLDNFEKHPEQWTWGSYAKDNNGREVGIEDERAEKFCAVGMMKRCARVTLYPLLGKSGATIFMETEAENALNAAADELYNMVSIVTVNDVGVNPKGDIDDVRFRYVKECYRKAIAHLKKGATETNG